MGLLQPIPASQAVRLSQDYYRINQPAVNNGDIFKIDVGARAIVVGPESDFAEYNVYYFDVTKQRSINIATVTVDQPWIGRLDARLDVTYPEANQQGFIYIVPKDYFIPAFLTGFTATTRVIFQPCVDIIVYTQDPPQIPDKRPSKKINSAFNLQRGINSVFFPVYGRKTWTVRGVYAYPTDDVFSNDPTQFQFACFGVKFALPTGATFSTSFGAQNILGPASPVQQSLGANTGFTFNSEDATTWGSDQSRGRFDYIRCDFFLLGDKQDTNDPSTVIQGGVQALFEAYD